VANAYSWTGLEDDAPAAWSALGEHVAASSKEKAGSTRALVVSPASKDGPGTPSALTSESLWRPAQFSSATIRNFIELAYCMNSAVFACVSTFAIAFAEPPMCVYNTKTKEKVPDGQHPLYGLLHRPNYLMGEREMWTYLATYMPLGGNGYLHKVRSRAGITAELWPYHQGQMRGTPGTKSDPRWLTGFEYNEGNNKWDGIPIEDVMHFKWMPDPRRPWQGQAPLEPAWREVLSDNELTRFLKALLANDAVPRTAITLDDEVSLGDRELERIKREFREKFSGDNIGDVIVLTGGIKSLDRIALNMDELALEVQRRVPEARISADLRVPALLAGLNVGLTEGREGNWESTRKQFTEGTLVPFWRAVESEVNQSLVPEYAPNGEVYCSFDLSQVQALKEDTNTKAQWVINGWDKTLFTRNQSLRKLGDDPLPGPEGDEYKAAPPTPTVHMLPAPGDPAGGDAGTGEDDTAKARARLEAKAKKQTRAGIEKQIKGAMADRIQAMYDAAAKALEGGE
jgi:HK97 family phage portal protein